MCFFSYPKMHYECKAETGNQLLARLGSRPDVKGLDQGLFFFNDSSSPDHGDILEISGDHSTGKTLYIIQILAQCLLPSKLVAGKETMEICVGGQEAGAILIVTDFHFQIAKLVQIMEQRLNNSFRISGYQPTESNISETVDNVIKKSLENLLTLNCYDSSQLFATFYSLEKHLSDNQTISVVALDSASAFYWQDMTNNTCSNKRMDSYLKSLVSTLENCVQEFKLLIIYSRPKYFYSKTALPKCSNPSSNGVPTFKIQLSHGEEESVANDERIYVAFQANVQTPSSSYVCKYFISPEGIMCKEKS